MNRKPGIWIALWVILVVATGFLVFGPHGMGYGPWHGEGRWADWHDRYHLRGGGLGPGMGPGMLRDHDGFHGMIDPQRTGARWPDAEMGADTLPPDLTSAQAQTIIQLQQQALGPALARAQHRWVARAELARLYGRQPRDWQAIRTAARRLIELRRQSTDAAIDLEQKIDAVLTDRQRRDRARLGQGETAIGAP